MGFIDKTGNYYEGDCQPGDVAATPAQEAIFAAQRAAVALKKSARDALDASDMVCLRCYKAGVAFPSAWQTYTTALRAIVNGTDTTSTTLPTQPSYPAGT